MTEVALTDGELELTILEKYTAWHQAVLTGGHPSGGKCFLELDMRTVLRESFVLTN